MTEEPKYYTPNISEFHIGFEYEFCTGDKTWRKFIFDLDRPENVLKNIEQKAEMFRAKFLDKEDIESLGWEYNPTHEYEFDCDIYKKEGGIELQSWGENKYSIETIKKDGKQIWFVGTLKNKSELKNQMERCGIV